MSSIQTGADPLWYKDAVIYEAHVRAFHDSNADGMGDFKGLAEKLDYLQELGVTAIWLLPFFPSPWKDDGYDISDFRSVHPAYGTLKDFQHCLKEAHARGLKVITELVVNHTSDQHEWFQRSRRAAPGSRWRDFYVWSDSPAKYDGVRIIFKDFEPSNWSWDPVAKAYYWHRFFSHQPDLNFDNPLVRRAVIRTLDYWAEMGVDGFRLDAIPYLFEREGTSCENLPETHDFLKELRRHMDENHPGRMLLAEANMWPEDAVAYFGEAGDECHMSFHFPLMPRLFMALRLEDRLPIVEILKRTPVIPETCQWAMFLRNHDELTLEMVTDEERDYMYRSYAADQRARINLGIRRRLAPLLGNDRPRIEVMNALLFSMPGTPVIYYGDEIGMGDNVYLGDRNGVRTPMQWNPDRNAGFSSANPQKLYLPVTIDPAYHYEAVNVESQAENPNSLLNWTKRLIALRKQYKAFGRGTLEFLAPANQRVIAYIRRYQEEVILVVANLSRFSQAAQLDLTEFSGYTPVEMFGRTDFPVVSAQPYTLTLGANSFFWFALEKHEAPVQTVSPTTATAAMRLPTVFVPSLANIWEESIRASIASILPRYLQTCRWFRSGNRRFRSLEITDVVPIQAQTYQFIFLRAEYATGDPEIYLLPVGCATGDNLDALKARHTGSLLAQIQAPGEKYAILFTATDNADFNTALLEAFARRKRFPGQHGTISAQRDKQFRKLWGGSHPDLTPVPQPIAELATSIRFGDRFVLKVLAKIEAGIHPGVEMGQVLSAHVAPFAGHMEYESATGEKTVLAMLHGFVPNQGNAWDKTLRELAASLRRMQTLDSREPELLAATPANIFDLTFALADPPAIAKELVGDYLDFSRLMGQRLAELHLKLASLTSDPAFAPEPFNDFYRQGLYHGFIGLTGRRLEFLRQRYAAMEPALREQAERVLNRQPAILQKLSAIFEQRIPSQRTRFHGRAHLGHVLVSTDDDAVLFDFDGDPAQHISERRIKRCPLRDAASMLISFAYATQVATRAAGQTELDRTTAYSGKARFWYANVSSAFLRGYFQTAQDGSFLPKAVAQQQVLIDAYLMERALLDIRADMDARPEFAGVPFRIILHLLDAQ